ncbi:hypothetical protein [uncultured Phascolarctobacterium sp.]|uniref:hypothetical protein n=1 Tax=Phascolarctobacterium sp. TaxID=2049039 RepID=UPI0025E02095|nr:hypothetical protein [uncultured Phascolarctobacterium sp.]
MCGFIKKHIECIGYIACAIIIFFPFLIPLYLNTFFDIDIISNDTEYINRCITIISPFTAILVASIFIRYREHLREIHEKKIFVNSIIAEISTLIIMLEERKVLIDEILTTDNIFASFQKTDFNYFSYYDSIIAKIGIINDQNLCSEVLKSYIYAKNTFSFLNFLNECANERRTEYQTTHNESLIIEHNGHLKQLSTVNMSNSINNFIKLKSKLDIFQKNIY